MICNQCNNEFISDGKYVCSTCYELKCDHLRMAEDKIKELRIKIHQLNNDVQIKIGELYIKQFEIDDLKESLEMLRS